MISSSFEQFSLYFSSRNKQIAKAIYHYRRYYYLSVRSFLSYVSRNMQVLYIYRSIQIELTNICPNLIDWRRTNSLNQTRGLSVNHLFSLPSFNSLQTKVRVRIITARTNYATRSGNCINGVGALQIFIALRHGARVA